MEEQDYYEILGVTAEASQQEIKQAYKKMALKHHPDKNKGNEKEAGKMFQKISEAYSVLSDPAKRKKYDEYGHLDEEEVDFDYEDLFHSVDDMFFFDMMNDMMNMEEMFKQFARPSNRTKLKNKRRMDQDFFKQFMGAFDTKSKKKKNPPKGKEEKPKADEKDDSKDWETESEEDDDGQNGKGQSKAAQGQDDQDWETESDD